MAYKSWIDDLKLIRNLVQDETENPYTSASAYGSSTDYVFALGLKDTASATPTNTELYNKDHRSNLPLIVTVSVISSPKSNDLADQEQLFGVMFRCFVSADSIWTFKTKKRGDEEMAAEKLNDIAYEFTNDTTIIAALTAQGLTLDRANIGDIRPATTAGEQPRQDYGYVMECIFLRTTEQ